MANMVFMRSGLETSLLNIKTTFTLGLSGSDYTKSHRFPAKKQQLAAAIINELLLAVHHKTYWM
jgi:hypothetical protein